jgi:hypothetical protein
MKKSLSIYFHQKTKKRIPEDNYLEDIQQEFPEKAKNYSSKYKASII